MIVSIPNPGVWGWPWHGLATGGVVAGKSITQPPNGNAWLIDIGLPAISLTSAESSEATANGYDWRNYAMISGGRVYDTALPNNAFIHVDDSSKCWLITLTFSYPSSNTVGISASIKRFGLFGHGATSAITKTTTAACEHIELTEALGNPVSTYSAREYKLSDVWTNGAKSLVGVHLSTVGYQAPSDLFSVLEITLSGSGGVDGSGLGISAAEVMGQPDLTLRHQSNGISDGIDEGTGIGLQWYGASGTGFGGGMDLLQERDVGWTFARVCYYSSGGVVKALRLRARETTDHWLTSAPGFTPGQCAGVFGNLCDVGDVYVTAEGFYSVEISILENSDVKDHLSAVSSASLTQRQMLNRQLTDHLGYLNGDPGAIYGETTDLCCQGYFYAYTEYLQDDWEWSGSLAYFYDQADSETITIDDLSDLTAAWRREIYDTSSANIAIGSKYFGLQRIDAKAAAFYASETSTGARTYGPISTPLGVKTYASTPSADIFFAWQRKTGDFSFSTSPICYV
jgi:hypothetical protein